MTMEVRTNERAKPKATTGRIRGTAAVFYRAGDPSTEYELWKGAVERIMPGAFDKTLSDRDVVALWNHDHTRPLGRLSAGTLSLNVDAVGLHYDITPGESPLHRDAIETVRRGDVNGSSFGFRVLSETWRDEGSVEVREINEVALIEVSPVTFPAYQATAAAVRNQQDLRDMRRQRKAAKRERRLRLIDILGESLCPPFLPAF